MEPQLPSPSQSPERAPVGPPSGEVFSGGYTPETAPETQTPENQETRERKNDSSGGDPAAIAVPALPSLPVTDPPVQDDPTIGDNANPVQAADDDLIEKEWVERAKKIIAETKHDPYLQEHEVSKLQADYLKKRYGKNINTPSDS